MTSWMIGATPLSALNDLDPSLAAQFFNRPESYVISGDPPAGWSTTPVTVYSAFRDYVKASPASHWVLYDPEKWSLTPPIERQHPKAFLTAFAELAHARGHQVIVTPARDLMSVAGADCSSRTTGLGTDAAYLACRIPAAGALADVFECQAQADQLHVTAYRSLVQGAKKQTRAGQPFWAGLTTLRGHPVSAIVECYEAVARIVDGFWLNTSAETISDAAEFLSRAKLPNEKRAQATSGPGRYETIR